MKKVLVVEDDKKVSMALAIRLKSQGYEVLTAADGVTGVSVAVKGMPDLILLDISMPAGDGFSVAERVQNLANTAGIPIIFLTASRCPGLRDRALEMGAVDFFEKPYDPDQLLSAIQKAMEERSPVQQTLSAVA